MGGVWPLVDGWQQKLGGGGPTRGEGKGEGGTAGTRWWIDAADGGS